MPMRPGESSYCITLLCFICFLFICVKSPKARGWGCRTKLYLPSHNFSLSIVLTRTFTFVCPLLSFQCQTYCLGAVGRQYIRGSTLSNYVSAHLLTYPSPKEERRLIRHFRF
ncbi:hypothetical protein, unlikely [Trypanosoma brucei gambiense DAL972]|uniref:T. brucei spp.-specific protein n=1 Tax=Trypanosoma brucei gambiense (strain MHOM/CI/86/DAL972) TaxID=679716 RepID=D0A744_TRYB9|nr:hypothetical protein, unlikely [Trypanosoma brucei gambiense DAL972]CBH17495.1 hypothetical protein, unlikely [Trypanosoma brucei gambiense DAL972]|eukprot:XP_011779759.1 hypothetical protein, unlikely [Trypanosoma brucei gambiense DAL972]